MQSPMLLFLFFPLEFYRKTTLWHLPMCLQYILVRYIPSIVLPCPSAPFLRTILTSFIALFSHINTKCIPPCSSTFTLSYVMPIHLPLASPSTGLVLLSCPSFLKEVYQGVLPLYFIQTCIYVALIRLTPSITLSLLPLSGFLIVAMFFLSSGPVWYV
jgi:hypothetical protein